MKKSDLEGLLSKLPATPGINGKEEYFNSAVLVPLILIEEEYHFLFEKRSASIRQPGEICFPGGAFDQDKDANYLETAIRETKEELGIDPGHIRIIGSLDLNITPTGATVDAFLSVVDNGGLNQLSINTDEVEEIFTIPVSYFEQTEPEVYQVALKAHPSHLNQNGEEIVSFPVKLLGLPEQYSKPWGNAKRRIYVYHTEKGMIWGLTARLIRDVASRLKS